MFGKAAQRPQKLDRQLRLSPYLDGVSKLNGTQPIRGDKQHAGRRTQQLPPLSTGPNDSSSSGKLDRQRRGKSTSRAASTSPTHSALTRKTERTVSELRHRVSGLESQLAAAETQLAEQRRKQPAPTGEYRTRANHSGGTNDTGEVVATTLETQLQAALAAEKAAVARAEDAEARLVKLSDSPRRQASGMTWRLSSKLVARQRHATQPPPPKDVPNDPHAQLASWLACGGTEAICKVSAKAMCNMVNPSPSSEVVDAAIEAALQAAAREKYHNDHASGRPLEVIKAALNEAAAKVVSACGGLITGADGADAATGAESADSMRLDVVSNVAAREWWRSYLGEQHQSVSLQTAIDAFVLYMKREGLPEAEAQIFGALAVYGMHGCHADNSSSTHKYGIHADDRDITVCNFDAFTKDMDGFSVASVRSKEVIREDEDAGSVEEFALYLGIDPEREPQLMWIAEQCRVAPLPMGWAEYMTVEGDSYFHNASRQETVWHHPLDIVFKQLVEVRRQSGKAYRPGQTYA